MEEINVRFPAPLGCPRERYCPYGTWLGCQLNLGSLGEVLGKTIVAEISPEELVRCIHFLIDVLTPMEAVQLLKDLDSGKEERVAEVM